jgi:4-hydroxy 2-oxovalerate aldolase
MYGIEHCRRSPARSTKAGVDAIEVAHGDGLQGSSFNYGFGAHTDWEWIEAVAEVVKNAVLTTLMLPGIGTVHELRSAYDIGVRSVRVATHCTEADVSKQHIEASRAISAWTSRLPDDEPYDRAGTARQQAQLMESYGAQCVYVTDSGGALDMDGVRARFEAYDRVLKPETQRGMHAHHNLSLGVANSHRRGAVRRDPRRCQPCRHGRGRGQCAAGGVHRRRRSQGLEPRLRRHSS